jgi:hypothetical protein
MFKKILDKYFSKKRKNNAFTLIEISIALVATGLVTGGAFGGKELIEKYQNYSDLKHINEAFLDDDFKQDLDSYFSSSSFSELKDGDEIETHKLIDANGDVVTVSTVSDEDMKKMFGDVDTSEYKNTEISNSVCGTGAIKFGERGDSSDSACLTRPIKVSGKKGTATNHYITNISMSLKNGDYKTSKTGVIASSYLSCRLKKYSNKESYYIEKCNGDLEIDIPQTGGSSLTKIKLNGIEDKKASIIENKSCGNVITYAKYEDDGNDKQALYLNNMKTIDELNEAATIKDCNDIKPGVFTKQSSSNDNMLVCEKQIDGTTKIRNIYFLNNDIILGMCFFEGAEISKLLKYNKNNINQKYITNKKRSVFFGRRRDRRRNKKDLKASMNINKRSINGYFANERRSSVLNSKGDDCTDKIVVKNECLAKDNYCAVNYDKDTATDNYPENTGGRVNNRIIFFGDDVDLEVSDDFKEAECKLNKYRDDYGYRDNADDKLDDKYIEGKFRYRCTESGIEIDTEKSNCKCRDGMYWDKKDTECKKIQCKIENWKENNSKIKNFLVVGGSEEDWNSSTEFDDFQSIKQCIEDDINNDDYKIEGNDIILEYTGVKTKTIQKNENCSGTLEYTCSRRDGDQPQTVNINP